MNIDRRVGTIGVALAVAYRDLIELFQRDNDLQVTRNIFPTDQNLIVQLNHADSSYMTWVRTTLQGLGLKGSSDKALVATFQNSTGLGNDGWIGAKTETAIIWTSGKLPPGHVIVLTKPKPKPVFPASLSRFLMIDEESAKFLAPATITPFGSTVSLPHRNVSYVRQRLAAAVRVAQFTHLRLAAMASKPDRENLWNSSKYLEPWWFGKYSDEKLQKVLSTLGQIVTHLRDARLKIICNENKSGYGSASPAVRKIVIGMAWVHPATGSNPSDDAERVQTFVHESAHISGRVIGQERKHYGRVEAHKLANDGMRATRNADNYGYYAIDASTTLG